MPYVISSWFLILFFLFSEDFNVLKTCMTDIYFCFSPVCHLPGNSSPRVLQLQQYCHRGQICVSSGRRSSCLWLRGLHQRQTYRRGGQGERTGSQGVQKGNQGRSWSIPHGPGRNASEKKKAVFVNFKYSLLESSIIPCASSTIIL